ncbi:MAG: mechanosensitive ion channel family protein [Clostridiales bacterium]|jgi:small conductance mechanosensitive channel|nr:mechanosensitive ion channel family protein [Clostridiales bacterium]
MEAFTFSFMETFTFSLILIRALEAIAIIIAGFALSKIAKKLVRKIIRPNKSSKDVILTQKRAETLQSVASSMIKYAIYFLTVYFLIEVFSREGANPLLAFAGAVGVAVGLGAQGLIKDVIAGFFIVFEDQYAIGDIVKIQGNTGTIEEIGLRATKLRGLGGELYIIPNGLIEFVTNHSRDYARAIVDIKVSQSEDINRVMDILEDEMKKTSHIPNITAPPVILGITEWGNANITVRLSATCLPGESWAVERALRLIIKTRFQADGVHCSAPDISIN